jgi:hypothetical protein
VRFLLSVIVLFLVESGWCDENLIGLWFDIRASMTNKIESTIASTPNLPCILEISSTKNPADPPPQSRWSFQKHEDKIFKFSIVISYWDKDGNKQETEGFIHSFPESKRDEVQKDFLTIQKWLKANHAHDMCEYKRNPPKYRTVPRNGDGVDCNGLNCERTTTTKE